VCRPSSKRELDRLFQEGIGLARGIGSDVEPARPSSGRDVPDGERDQAIAGILVELGSRLPRAYKD